MISLILYLQKVSAYIHPHSSYIKITYANFWNMKAHIVFILFQLDKVGRRRRNEFEDFVHYKPNINSILMKFDRQDLLGDSALYENNFHVAGRIKKRCFFAYDAALISLPKPFRFDSNVNAACLPNKLVVPSR